MSFWNSVGSWFYKNALGLIGIGADALGKQQQHKWDKEAMAAQNQYVLGQMAQQNQYNIDAFNRENAYNTPSAQRQRMMQAGLNPNFVDGGTVVAQQDSSTGGSSTALNSVDMSSLIGSFAQLSTLPLQKKIMQKQADNIQADTNKKNAETDYTNNSLKKVADAQYEALISQSNLNDEQRKYVQQQVDSFRERLDAELSKLNAETASLDYMIQRADEILEREKGVLDAQQEYYLKQAAYADVLAYYEGFKAQTDRITANASMKSANASYKQALAALQNAKTNKFSAMVGLKEVNEAIRHNKAAEGLTKALNESIQHLNYSSAAFHDANTFYQELKNKVEKKMEENGMLYHERQLIISKLSADRDYIISQKIRNEQDARLFEDTYFGKVYNEYLPHFLR